MSTPSFDDLEKAYETLAAAIDQAGPEHESVFLAKLALALAGRLACPADFDECVAIALADLERQQAPA